MDILKEEVLTTKNMVRISMLAVVAVVIMFFKVPLPFAPPFMKLDISDVPALIGSFAMGPLAGVVVQLLKNILHIVVEGSSTGGVGELSNFIVGSSYVVVAGLVYHSKKKTFNRAILGICLGTISMTLLASLSNYFIIFPLYSNLMPLDEIIELVASINSLVVDYKSLILFAVVPFNLVKGAVNAMVTILVYKRISPYLKD